MKHINALVAAALVLGGGTVQAGLINPGFENGLSGWNINLTGGSQGGSATAVPFIASLQNPPGGGNVPPDYWYPQEGQYFLALGTGASGPDIWQSVTQTITVADGTTLTGNAAFDWNAAYNPFIDTSDGARVSIFQGSSATGNPYDTPFDWNGDSLLPPDYLDYVPDYYNGPWIQWNSIALAAGTYTIEYAVRNTGDTRFPSFGYFDSVTAVPEPATLALFVIGLAGLTGMKRRKTVSLNG